jgi:RNA polymerase II subunit A C-terminal domain phosphatase SSU72
MPLKSYNCNDLMNPFSRSYTQNGLLHMLDRNRRLKLAPERFQNCEEKFDVIITCEERVYDQVVDFLETKGNVSNTPVHIINIDIIDNHDEAVKGAFIICDLVTQLARASDLDDQIDETLALVEDHADTNFLHCIMFY